MKKTPTSDQASGVYGEQLSFLPTPESATVSFKEEVQDGTEVA